MNKHQHKSLSFPEGGTYTFKVADFSVQSGRLTFVTLDIMPRKGTILYDNAPLVGAGCSISAIDILLGNLIYEPEPGATGPWYATFEYTTISNFKSTYSGSVVFNITGEDALETVVQSAGRA
ncbi:hypothetical protein [Kordiimonas pumila]|uniref:Uncharacterized protein n=1 Tax=Kordiimonas pumila TaxID=2161677 RepID=A0ABV7D343_9PROT|nr:hypothetical protein [Kordiimonas pumila]